jgi:hypothetical protein
MSLKKRERLIFKMRKMSLLPIMELSFMGI